MKREVILHLVQNPVTHDSRVLKETKSIQDAFSRSRVEICGFLESAYKEREVLDGRPVWRVPLKSRPLPRDLASQAIKYAEWYARVVTAYGRAPLRVIHCHDLIPLPIAVTLKSLTGAKLIYDAHELETEMASARGMRKRLSKGLERRLIRAVDAMITVSPSIEAWYRDKFPDVPISIVRNIPESPAAAIDAVPLREKLRIPKDALLFIYLGGLGRGRGIEAALAAFQYQQVPHHVLFMGSGTLRAEIEGAARTCSRIHYMSPVAPSAVLSHTAGADCGLCLYEDTCLNHRYCLPNKLFETLLAGLPVLASDLPDQAEVVRKYQAGWVVPNEPGKIAEFLMNLSVERAALVRRGLRERIDDLSWSNEAKNLVAVYNGLGITD